MIESVVSYIKDIKDRYSGEYAQRMRFGPASVLVKDYRKIQGAPHYNNFENINLAQQHGFKPLTIEEILNQISVSPSGIVVFDKSVMETGNHWRILDVNEEKQTARLQLTHKNGLPDYRIIPPMKVPSQYPMFTGTLIPHYTHEGRPVSLSTAAFAQTHGFSRDLVFKNRTTLWSDPTGQLVRRDHHPYFRRDISNLTYVSNIT